MEHVLKLVALAAAAYIAAGPVVGRSRLGGAQSFKPLKLFKVLKCLFSFLQIVASTRTGAVKSA